MGLRTTVFPSGWAATQAARINAAMTGRVRIERTLTEGTWNPATGNYDSGTSTLLYLGRANIDRVARPRRGSFDGDVTDNQVTQIMIPVSPALNEAVPVPSPLHWHSNDMVTILVCPGMPMLEGEKVFLRGWFGATEDWAYTLHGDFDSKEGLA